MQFVTLPDWPMCHWPHCEEDSPVKDEDDENQHEGQQISENPHQVILIWTLKQMLKSAVVISNMNKFLTLQLTEGK